MSDPVPTRQDTVEANIEAVEKKYGPDEFGRIITACIKDISVSLAMLVDAGSNTSGSGTSDT